MKKKYVEQNVYDATQDRLKFIFDNYEKVCVSFSGGKDSGLCLNLCYDYAKKTNQLDKLAFYHLDYECQYTMTTEYVTECFNNYPEIKDKFWVCLPLTVPCNTSMTDGFWVTWDSNKKEIWARGMPDSKYVINESNKPFEFEVGISDYKFQEMFDEWLNHKFGKTAIVIGIRTDESLDRFRAISGNHKSNIAYDKPYLVGNEKLAHAYIIYDWNVEDVFIANYKFNYSYNKLYDLMYQAGVNLHDMRVASPFLGQGLNALKLYRVIEPNMWGKLLGRVNGVNFAGIYGGTTAMGWKTIKLPEGHTWKSYLDFLLSTLSEEMRNLYLKKFKVSEEFWIKKGGVLDKETIDELKESGVKFEIRGKTNYNTDKMAVTFPEYPDDLENVTKFQSVPSYKRMCVCIMKNDFLCKYMGFNLTKEEMNRRKAVMEKYSQVI